MHLPRWSRAFAGERKDHRFYELIEDTLKDGFSYGYFVVDDGADITPLSRVSCIKLGRLLSISFSRKAASYFPRPRLDHDVHECAPRSRGGAHHLPGRRTCPGWRELRQRDFHIVHVVPTSVDQF